MIAAEQSDEWEEVAGWRGGLEALHARIAARFKRVRVRRYVAALLERVDRKNGWQRAEQLGESGPQGVQRLLNTARWDADAVRDDLRDYVVEHLGDADGVLIIAESGVLKKGTQSVGVKRQDSGTAGRVENGQVGVFLAYASARGRAFLDRALYLPQEWAADAARRAEAGVPPEVAFATKGALARAMLARAFAAGVPAAWVTGDEVYGDDGGVRGWLEEQRRPYVLAVSCAHHIQDGPYRGRVAGIVAELPEEAWIQLSAGAGSQGPRLCDGACGRLPETSAPGMAHGVLVRRSLSDPTDLAYYRASGPEGTPLEDLVRVAGTRWAIEESIKGAKGEAGLDHYQVRRWDAWYRHITLALLAHAYLEVTRAADTTAPLLTDGAKKGTVQVRFLNLEDRSRPVNADALVDTGADVTSVPDTLIDLLSIDVELLSTVDVGGSAEKRRFFAMRACR